MKEQEAGDRTAPIAKHAGMAVLTLGALGVVFGDIGTSPLYALQTVFHASSRSSCSHSLRRPSNLRDGSCLPAGGTFPPVTPRSS